MVAIASAYQRPEPWARQVFEARAHPRVALPACGLLQVSNPGRFVDRALPFFITDILENCADNYLPGDGTERVPELADPLVFMEQAGAPDRPLPAFFLPVGTRDPLQDDTRRMESALSRLGVPCQARYYKGELHAFHALIWRQAARDCWKEMMAFTARYLD